MVSGAYDTYSVSAVVDLDTNGDDIEDGCESVQQGNAAFMDNMTIDFSTASPC